jgi:hypothetical protein
MYERLLNLQHMIGDNFSVVATSLDQQALHHHRKLCEGVTPTLQGHDPRLKEEEP